MVQVLAKHGFSIAVCAYHRYRSCDGEPVGVISRPTEHTQRADR
jgi:hypothetical protein